MARLLRIAPTSNRRRLAAADKYLGAYINRGSAGNNTIDLKFNGGVAEADLTTGVTIGVRAGSSGSYSTLDLASTTPSIANADYIRYTLTGTVKTFQAGHEVQVSISSSATFTIGGSAAPEVTNDAALINSSTINLLSDVGEIWHMENADAAIDSANNMVNVNSERPAATFVAGKLRSAGDFERSSNQYLKHTDSAGISIGDNSFTYACWIKLESTDVWQGIATDMTWLGTGTPSHHLAVSSGNKIYGKVWGASSNADVYSTSTLSTGTWYHVALIHDKGTDVKIAVDGSVGEDTTTYTGGGKDGTNDLVFGGYSDGNTLGAFDGLIDEMTWLSKAISTAELTDLYNNGDGKAYPYLPDLGVINAKFTATNGTLMTAYTPDYDATGSSTFTVSGGTPEIQSNKMESGHGVWETGLSQVKLSGVGDNTASGSQYGVQFRYADSNNYSSGYYTKTNDRIEIWEQVSGTWTECTSCQVSHTGSSTDSFAWYIYSDRIVGIYGDTQASHTSTTGNSNTKHGPMTDISGNGTVDNFVVGGLP
jgi:hypothetical protein